MSAPVRHTCPDIDNMISNLCDAYGHCEIAISDINGEDYEGAKSTLKDALWILEDFKSKYNNPLENLRSDNSSLRDWGHDLEKDIDELEDEASNLREQITLLEFKVDDLEDQLHTQRELSNPLIN